MPGRVLIVAPHFAPTNAPDGHRVRMLLPWLRDFGWEATVLTVRPDRATAPLEPDLEKTIPDGVVIRRVDALRPQTSRRFGVGNLAWRSLPWLWREGSRLLRTGNFDVVYFSTTQFACLPLGRWWRRQFGTPYVIDLQDPWHNVYYARKDARPPGGWKYRVAACTTRSQEGWTLRRCSHVVTVSATYVDDLSARRPWFDRARATVLPFGWSKLDQEAARSRTVGRMSGPTILYVGRVGEDMAQLLRGLLAAYAEWLGRRDPVVHRIRWRFVGTSYSPHARAGGTATRVAAEVGVAAHVSEECTRVGYLDSLAQLQASPANLLLGSDDLGYSPSKIWPTLAVGRPWLACGWPDSVLLERLQPHATSGLPLALGRDGVTADQQMTLFRWFDRLAAGSMPAVSSPALQAFHADRMAEAHADIFNAVTS